MIKGAGSDDKSLQYIRDVFAPEDEALKQVGRNLEDSAIRMQTKAEEGKILQLLVKLNNAKHIVEIGTLSGYSTIWLARAITDGGRIFTIEKNKKRIEPILENFKSCKVDNKISLICGTALDELPKIENQGPFDMIFIDADKGGYCDYLDWSEKNIKKGGLIVGDNTFLFGALYGQLRDGYNKFPQKTIDVMNDFNKRLANEEKYTSILLPTFEGLTVAIKNF